jgi:hypothetical protein
MLLRFKAGHQITRCDRASREARKRKRITAGSEMALFFLFKGCNQQTKRLRKGLPDPCVQKIREAYEGVWYVRIYVRVASNEVLLNFTAYVAITSDMGT